MGVDPSTWVRSNYTLPFILTTWPIIQSITFWCLSPLFSSLSQLFIFMLCVIHVLTAFTAFLTPSRTLQKNKFIIFFFCSANPVSCVFFLCVCVCVRFSESEVWQWRTNLPQMSPAAYFLPLPPLLIVQSPSHLLPLRFLSNAAVRSRPAPWQPQHRSFVCVACNCMNSCVTVTIHSISFGWILSSPPYLSYEAGR